jgi:hypothetical protein
LFGHHFPRLESRLENAGPETQKKLALGHSAANGVIQLVSTRETYEGAKALAADLNNMLRHYIRAKVILAVLSLIFCSGAMLFLGYRHALALGLIAGACWPILCPSPKGSS